MGPIGKTLVAGALHLLHLASIRVPRVTLNFQRETSLKVADSLSMSPCNYGRGSATMCCRYKLPGSVTPARHMPLVHVRIDDRAVQRPISLGSRRDVDAVLVRQSHHCPHELIHCHGLIRRRSKRGICDPARELEHPPSEPLHNRPLARN